MNISKSEVPVKIVAKTCGCTEKNKKKVTYQFIDSYHSLCLDKKDIIYAELEACERLLKYASDEGDKRTVQGNHAQYGSGCIEIICADRKGAGLHS